MKYSFAKAFSLTELMVSLAILGIISGLSVPKVLSGMGDLELKAKHKEAFETLSRIVLSVANDNGKTNYGTDFRTAIANNLSYSTLCNKASSTAGYCSNVSGPAPWSTASSAVSYYTLISGVVLGVENANDTEIQQLYVDVNGLTLPNTFQDASNGNDIIVYFANIGLRNVNYANYANTGQTYVAKVGEVYARPENTAAYSLGTMSWYNA